MKNKFRREGLSITVASVKRSVAFYRDKLEGVVFAEPPHDEPWERSMTAYDPDGHSVEFA